MAKKITGKPNIAVNKLGAPTRQSGNRKMKATWKVPATLVNTNNARRAESLEIDWFLGIPGNDPKQVITTNNERATESTINLDSLKIGRTTYTRKHFYPLHKTRKLSYVTVQVIPKNRKGRGKAVKAQRNFGVPRSPSLSAISFNSENGVVTCNIKTNAGTDHYERYDTKYAMTIENTRTKKKWNSSDASSTSTDFNVSYNVSDYQQLSYSDYVRVTVSAYARGYAGNSKSVSRTYYVAYPAQTTITGVEVSSKDSAGKCTVYIKTNSTAQHPVDRVKLEYLANCDYATTADIPGDANWTESNIIDDSSCTALAIPVAQVLPSAGKYTWVRVKSYHADENVLYRYSAPMRVEALETPAPTAADDEITIVSAGAGANGDSAVVTLGWNADGQDDSDGTELSWSDEEDTWKSTESPSLYTFDWSDGKIYNPTEDTEIVQGKKYFTRSGAGTEEDPYVYTEVVEPVVGELSNYYEISFHDSATVIIKGLGEGSKYYIRARRYMEGEKTTYSPYSNTATVITSQRPESIVANSDRYVPTGDPLTVRWTFSGYSLQTGWQIVQNTWYELATDEVAVIGKPYYARSGGVYTEVVDIYQLTSDISIVEDKDYFTRSGEGTEESPYTYTRVAEPVQEELSNYYELRNPAQEGWYVLAGGAIIANGTGSLGSTQISAERLEELAINNSLTFTVQVSTGSSFVVSEEHTVTIVDAPVLSIDVSPVLTAQPFSFNATATSQSDLIVIVRSQGITGQTPGGVVLQASGDTVHSAVYAPVWGLYELTEDVEVVVGKIYYTRTGTGTVEDPYVYAIVETPVQEDLAIYYELVSNDSVNITIPSGLDFWDSGRYTVYVTAVDRESGLRSGEVTAEFEVAWANQAVDPAEAVTLTVIDETDEDGDHRQAVEIALTPPVGSSETDVYDIYRMDVENPSLIGEGFPLTHTVVDEYAPFGDEMPLFYRIALRTIDGDVEFADIEYEAQCKNLRFDWSGGYLELPYGITMGDSYKKDVDIRNHMNGSTDGYWNQNIERKSALSTDVIKIIQPRDIEKVRMLARYAGAVFVRKPDGSAFEADVQVTDLSRKNEMISHVAFDATEVGLTNEFVLPIPFELEEEEP